MKALFSDRDPARIARCEGILKDAGIETFLRNQAVSTTEAMIPIFEPALCVVHDEDFDRAADLLAEHEARAEAAPGEEITCGVCGEKNPGNFVSCWNCESALVAE